MVSRFRPSRRVSSLVWIFVLFLPLICAGAEVSRSDVHLLAHDVDKHYNHLHSLRATFVETYRGAGMERTESGTLWLKKPGKMRWEYRSPKEKLFLGDGKDAWFYVPGDQQARRTPMRKLDDLQSPLAFMLGKTKLEKELRGLSIASDAVSLTPSDVVLRGAPTVLAERVSQVLLEITPEKQISRIVIEERDGSVTEYRFSEQSENVEVGDQLFHFAPPPGVEIINGELDQ
jgi:outer membrane lipoprotein carrier protein